MKKSILILAAAICCIASLRAQSFNIGATYEGGIIFYIEPGKTWGLCAAPNDLPPNYWPNAIQDCDNFTAGHKGFWRLPTIEELRLLYDKRDLVGNFSTGNQQYWSSTTDPGNSAYAIAKFFAFGFNGSEGPKLKLFESLSIRPIRRFYIPLTSAGIEEECIPSNGTSTANFVPGPAKFTYGSGLNMKSSTRRTTLTVGDLAVGIAQNDNSALGFGIMSDLLLPPTAPIVVASQGELLDRIQISWKPNPLGAQPTSGYKLYRDGVFLGGFDNSTRNFNDFNVIAGRPYTYEVVGANIYGDGAPGAALGFQVPNGIATGYIQTVNGSPVIDATVTLTPMQGFSIRFGTSDVAFAEDSIGFFHNASNWTVSTWVQTDSVKAASKLLAFEGAPWSITPILSSTGHEGVTLNVTGQTPLNLTFPDSSKHAWHHISLTHDGSQFRFYLDGTLAGSIIAAAGSSAVEKLNIGAEGSSWFGRLDELRIYHRRLDELDFDEVMAGTASSLTPGLRYYWKMDEELGSKSFDVINRERLFLCGASFDASRPPVHTSGKSDADGYYRIESVNYGTGTTFIAKPSKLFYMHRSLKFVRSESDYATLPDFGLTDSTNLQTATLELWANSAGPDGTQCLLSKKWGSNEFRLFLTPNGTINTLKYLVNGTEKSLGNFNMGYQHIALTFQQNGSTLEVSAYKNGVSAGTNSFTGVTGNWSDTSQVWLLGARKNGATNTDYFGGLLDELAVYDTILPLTAIQAHVAETRDGQERHLRGYFSMDEGAGTRLNNSGAKLTGAGKTFGTDWSAFCAIQQTEPHVFSPNTRQVTINPSVTSVDYVDFTDRSTVPVSGYVRYANSDCFVAKVEILINDASASPAIYTDSTGRFVVDLEPGATVTLSPKLGEHVFAPAFWDITNISSPIAGILFSDMTTRSVDGQVAGGNCKLPIIQNPGTPQGTICKVKIRTKDGCYEKTQQILNEDGIFEFTGLPPTEYTISVIEHSDPEVYAYFQTAGGQTIDLTEQDTILDLIYHSQPFIEVYGLDPTPPCTQLVFDQGDEVTITIKLGEDYYGLTCFVDTAAVHILNGFSEEIEDTNIGGLEQSVEYKFTVGDPNPVPPFLQTMQILATTLDGNEVSYTKQAVITGLRSKESTFTTAMPQTPWLVLRDPPGDGSYAYWEKGQTVCNTTTMTIDNTSTTEIGTEFHLGPEFEIGFSLFGVSESTPFDTNIDFGLAGQGTTTKIDGKSFETCVTFDKRISTSEDELVVGAQGGDVFVGGGMNMIFGFADMVSVDANCVPTVKTVLDVQPDGFATTFMYSEWYIRKYVMRYLDSLSTNPGIPPAEQAKYLVSKNRWMTILDNNDAQKTNAKFKENISFDAGSTYEYSASYDTTNVIIDESNNISGLDFNTTLGFTFGGLGLDFIVHTNTSTAKGKTKEDGTQSSLTTGFVLKDNDVGDAFSVDISLDPVYKTSVFNTKIGQSSCPWEPGTAHREGTKLSLRDGSGPVANDVPANEPAVYKFTLGNTSATNELRTYAFTSGPESNPDGAVIKLNGAVLDHPVYYAIPNGESIPITLTLERGPEKYDYDSLEVVLYSECEDTRAGAIGILPDDDPVLYSAIYISAHFIQPCSEVDINTPQQNWVIHPDPTTSGPDDILNITFSGYDKSQADFESVKLQYRQADGDGAWLNITPQAEVLKANLGATFTNLTWNTTGLADGDYELRATAICGGDASGKPGYSQIIKGRIDRQPPSVVGTPQPSDGVFNVGDEISVTFNKNIDCGKIFAAVIGDPNNVGLYDVATNTLIDAQITCYENKITLVPNFQNEYLENHILRLDLHDIPDKTGNVLSVFSWEFYVDRNELAWLTDSIGTVKYDDESAVLTAKIHNRGGSPVPFSMQSVPTWVRVVPNTGTLVPNEVREIRFEIDSLLARGNWADSIVLHTETGQNPFFMGGDEGLPIGVRVICRPPQWKFNTGLYPNTMSFAVKLNIEGVLSADAEDQVAAYIHNELRGSAKVKFVPQLNSWIAFLTVYGDVDDMDEPIDLEIWDASDCLRYGDIMEQYEFQPDNLVGAAENPVILHTSGQVLREIPLTLGWNWISFNLGLTDPAINPVLSTLVHPEDDYIKNQTQFSEYFGTSWFGSLSTLGNSSLYQYRASQPDTLKLIGELIDPATHPLSLTTGWNWISYLPNVSLPIDDALNSLTPVTGDLLKSQFGFAQYVSNFGWIGSITHMQPPQGYQLKMTNAGTLTYPNSNFRSEEETAKREGPSETAFWQVNPAQYEYSMTLIGMIAANGENSTLSTQELGAFVGNELRGSSQAIYVEPLNAYLFFITIYANQAGELLHFKRYDSQTAQVDELQESRWFSADAQHGSIASPVPFTLESTGMLELINLSNFEAQPNPFSNSLNIRFHSTETQDVLLRITDVTGHTVWEQKTAAVAGVNSLRWNAEAESAGVYFVHLQGASGQAIRKVVKQ